MRVRKLNNFKKVMLGAIMATVLSTGAIGVSADSTSGNLKYNLKYKVTASPRQSYAYLERTGETSKPIKVRAYGYYMDGTKAKSRYSESGEAYRGIGVTCSPPNNFKFYQGGGKFYFGGEVVDVNGKEIVRISA